VDHPRTAAEGDLSVTGPAILRQQIGNRLRLAREKERWSLRAAAAELEARWGVQVSVSTMARIERGEQRLSLSMLAYLAVLYNTRTDKLLFNTESKIIDDLMDELGLTMEQGHRIGILVAWLSAYLEAVYSS